MFENLLERIEDLEDQVDMQSALIDYHAGKTVDAEEVFKRKVARRSEKVYRDLAALLTSARKTVAVKDAATEE